MSPKPAYDVLHRLIKDKWWTRTNVRTDDQGKAAFRGTLGQYQIIVTVGGKQSKPQTLELRREQASQVTVRLSS
jgi:hypothetical protein